MSEFRKFQTIPDGLLSSSESLAYAEQSELSADIVDIPSEGASSELAEFALDNLSCEDNLSLV